MTSLITIKDVAQMAGVSIATVSMALNRRKGISEPTAKKVFEAAERLGYTPSLAAKTLKTNRSGTLGLLIGDVTNPFFPDIIKGSETAARKRGYSLLICTLTVNNDDAVKNFDDLIARNVDGIFMSGVQKYSPAVMAKIKMAQEAGIKMMGFGKSYEPAGVPIVYNNEDAQIDSLLTRLVGYGHKQIGCIAGPADFWVTQSRLRVFRGCLEQFGVYHEALITHTSYSTEYGNAATMKLLIQHPEITALMCMADILAIGCCQAAKDLGRSIPGQLSLFSIDGIACTQYFSPKITTIDVNRYEVGYQAIERLIGAIEGDTAQIPPEQDQTYIDTSIIPGETIAPIQV